MENIKNLQEIQMEIKKELGGASLNHLLQYTHLLLAKNYNSQKVFFLKFESYTWIFSSEPNTMLLRWEKSSKTIFRGNFILLNEQKQALNIFGQSEDFQRKLYDAMQTITDREGENDTIPHHNSNH
ncbi:hypothetical protein UFOVP831_9 [uncultured Caudovirales phage]|uniref:Uncharacterized protein n=1 Tax=uncultured Caudovirales phage TaxID=2100421 RepID=A0A6J5NYP8_9CAUD|nr:hypothetical protein UFOVP831_9 [uncultured Caudovirales phage]